MKIKLFASGILFLIAQTAPACQCDYRGPFLKMSKHTPLVALVKVTKHLSFKNIYDVKTPMSMEVEIVEVYKGNESRKTITVWGDNGILCRPYLSEFKEQEYFVIAFYKSGSFRGNDGEKESDYFISVCGAYWLNVDYKNSTATGDVKSNNMKAVTIKLSDLTADLLKEEK